MKDLEYLVKHYQDPEGHPLSRKQKDILERLERARDLFREHYSRLQVIPVLMREFNISQASANRAANDAQELFGKVSRNKAQFHLDILLDEVRVFKNAAIVAGDRKAEGIALKLYWEIIAKAMEQTEHEAVVIPQNELGYFPETLGVELPENYMAIIEKITGKKISQQTAAPFLEAIAEDIEHEEADGDE